MNCYSLQYDDVISLFYHCSCLEFPIMRHEFGSMPVSEMLPPIESPIDVLDEEVRIYGRESTYDDMIYGLNELYRGTPFAHSLKSMAWLLQQAYLSQPNVPSHINLLDATSTAFYQGGIVSLYAHASLLHPHVHQEVIGHNPNILYDHVLTAMGDAKGRYFSVYCDNVLRLVRGLRADMSQINHDLSQRYDLIASGLFEGADPGLVQECKLGMFYAQRAIERQIGMRGNVSC